MYNARTARDDAAAGVAYVADDLPLGPVGRHDAHFPAEEVNDRRRRINTLTIDGREAFLNAYVSKQNTRPALPYSLDVLELWDEPHHAGRGGAGPGQREGGVGQEGAVDPSLCVVFVLD